MVSTHPSVASSSTLSLPHSATVGRVQKHLEAFHRDVPGEGTLEIDMRRCQFVEPATLMLLIAHIRDRQTRELKTTVRLPQSRDVRDFFRTWRFPQALRDATGLPFHQVVCDHDLKYFGEAAAGADVKYQRKYQGLALPPSRFFGISSFFARNIASGEQIAKEESRSWKHAHVLHILDKHLAGLGQRIASHIIYEAMMNAFRHPAASIIQCTSHLEGWDDRGEAGVRFLTIVFWDDGASIVDTLRDGLAEYGSGSFRRIPSLCENYALILEDEDGTKKPPEVISSDCSLSKDDLPERLLLAATFPGVTRDPTGLGHIPNHEVEEDEALKGPGMGLFVLTNTVVEVFGGALSLRTGNLFMNIKPPDGSLRGVCKYRVKTKKYGPSLPPFLGNMVTIRLPLS